MLAYDNSDSLCTSQVLYDSSLSGLNLLSLYIENANNVKALLHGTF